MLAPPTPNEMKRVLFTAASILMSLASAQQLTEEDENLIKSVFNPQKREVYNPGSPDECVCVRQNLCPNGSVLTDGQGLIDIRMKGLRIGENGNNINKCNDYMEVCCKDPSNNNNPFQAVPYVRKGCGRRNPTGVTFKITGNLNSESQFGEFPWMIAVMKKYVMADGSVHLAYHCGGALINEKVVLTTAHCVTWKLEGTSGLIARAGEWDSQRTNEVYAHQDRQVMQTITHPQYRLDNLWNDFALLIMDKPFILSHHIDTVCLPPPGVVPLSRECYASGWGKDKFNAEGQYQLILKKVDLPIVTKDQCISLLRKTRLGPYFQLHESFVCAGGNGKDTCTGDGGSPLVCPIQGKPETYQVTGLVAWGIGCGDETPGVYAGVAYARNWIDATMAQLGYTTESIDMRL